MTHASPIIFIHGLFSTSYTTPVSRFFFPHPVTIPDLPGYGTNRSSPAEYSIGAAAEFIHARLNALGYDQAHLVGDSVGGVIAVVAASRYPETIASLISVEGVFDGKGAFWSQQFARLSKNEAEAALASYRTDPRAWLNGAGIEATAEQIDRAARSLAAQPASTLQTMAHSVVQTTSDASYLHSVAALLDRSIPFHLVAGERSRAGWNVPDWILQRASSVTIQAGVGHLMMLEDEYRFLAIMRDLILS
jgi:pimeloyl-ACP methyl ester carboxylesterase